MNSYDDLNKKSEKLLAKSEKYVIILITVTVTIFDKDFV